MPQLVYNIDEMEQMLCRVLPPMLEKEIAKILIDKRDKRLNMKEAAKFMNMSQSTLAKKLKSGDFPLKLRHVVGSSKYFLESELRVYLKQ